MNILVTGGTGFIGAELTKLLVAQGEKPIVFDIQFRPERMGGIEDKVIQVKGDVSNLAHVMDVVKKYKIQKIFHLGSMLSVPSDADPASAFHVNAEGTFNILEAARILDVEQVLFSSTIATYGADLQSEVLDDFSIQRPKVFYGCTKVFAELMGRFYKHKYGLDFRAVRYPSIPGPGVKTPGIVQYTAWSIEKAIKGEPFTIWVTPETVVPTMYYKDAALSILRLSEAPLESIKMIVYILAGIKPFFSAQTLVDSIKKYFPAAELNFAPDPIRMEQVKGLAHPIDDHFAVEEFGWECEFSLEGMIEDFIKMYQENPEKYL